MILEAEIKPLHR